MPYLSFFEKRQTEMNDSIYIFTIQRTIKAPYQTKYTNKIFIQFNLSLRNQKPEIKM